MKVKVKGLVFVGFAAAVFAQSAFAAITPNATTDPKTVTSKKYVDEKIPGTASIYWGDDNGQQVEHTNQSTVDAVVVGNGYGEVKFRKLSDTATSTIDTTTPANGSGIVVTAKAVAEAINANMGALQGDDAYIDVESSTDGNGITTKTVKPLYTPSTSAADLVTSGTLAVGDSYNSTTATADDVTEVQTRFATSKAVYDYAQPKVADTSGALQVGYRGATGDATWKTLQGSSTGTAGALNYVSIKEGTGANSQPNGVYTVNLDASTITANNNNGADITAAGVANATAAATDKLATAKAVYDFVKAENAAYQPKVQDTDHDKLMLGYSTQGGTVGSETYTLGWKELQGSSNAAQSAVNYVSIAETSSGSNVYKTNLASDLITTTGAAINGYDATTSSGNGNDLVTVSAIKEYAGGIIDVTNPCSASATDGHYCALVAKYSASAPNNVEYEWTIMAPQQ